MNSKVSLSKRVEIKNKKGVIRIILIVLLISIPIMYYGVRFLYKNTFNSYLGDNQEDASRSNGTEEWIDEYEAFKTENVEDILSKSSDLVDSAANGEDLYQDADEVIIEAKEYKDYFSNLYPIPALSEPPKTLRRAEAGVIGVNEGLTDIIEESQDLCDNMIVYAEADNDEEKSDILERIHKNISTIVVQRADTEAYLLEIDRAIAMKKIKNYNL